MWFTVSNETILKGKKIFLFLWSIALLLKMINLWYIAQTINRKAMLCCWCSHLQLDLALQALLAHLGNPVAPVSVNYKKNIRKLFIDHISLVTYMSPLWFCIFIGQITAAINGLTGAPEGPGGPRGPMGPCRDTKDADNVNIPIYKSCTQKLFLIIQCSVLRKKKRKWCNFQYIWYSTDLDT